MRFSRKARETGLRLLFQWEMSKEKPERVKELYWVGGKGEQPAREAAGELFDAVVERLEAIDPLLRKHSTNWRLERLSAVDRNILRLAVCEMLARPKVSYRTAITEAIDLAHRYSTDESAHFINGVLDAVRRSLGKGDDS